MKNWKTNESSISSIPTSVRRPFDNSASPQTTAIDSVPRIHLAGVIPGRSVNQTSARSDDVGSLSMDCYPATYLPVTYLFASEPRNTSGNTGIEKRVARAKYHLRDAGHMRIA